MNNEGRTLWLSLGAGIFAAFLLYSYSQEKKAQYDAQYGAMKNVVVAKKDIKEMDIIDDSMLEVVQRPCSSDTAGDRVCYIEPNAITEPELAVGQVAAIAISMGEQLITSKLLHPGPVTGIALQVAPEKRAIAIPVDEVRSVAKLIRPGDRIDIYAAIDVGKGMNQRREVSLIMSDVVILATGENIMNSIPVSVETDNAGAGWIRNLNRDNKFSTVTIEANSREAQDLIYLMSTSPGNIFFTLRNPNDRKTPPRMPSSNSDTILGRTSIQPEVPVPQNIIKPPAMMPPAMRR
jgi:pilus assembly protein CpaB